MSVSNIFLGLLAQLNKLARHCRQGSFETRRLYYQGMKRVCRFLAEAFHLEKLCNINGKHLAAYVVYLQESGKSASTIKTDLAAIRFFHDQMDAKYQLPDNDALSVELEQRRFGGVDRTWSDEEFNRMIEKAVSEGRDDVSCSLIIGRFVGLRIHEVMRLDTAAAERALREDAITIKGKGGKIRTVPIEDERIPMMLRKRLTVTPRGHKLLVPDDVRTDVAISELQQFITEHRAEAKDPDSDRPMTFHGLRHTYAVEKYKQFIAAGMTEMDAHYEVSRLLGHERPDVTDIYLASV